MSKATSSYTRIIVGDIPYYIDSANHVYAYGIESANKSYLQIGEYDPVNESVQLVENWQALFETYLPAYRTACVQRLRLDPSVVGKTIRAKRTTVPKKKESTVNK